MAYVEITNAPNVEKKYKVENGQVKIAYVYKTEPTKANRGDREVWVATAIRGQRVKLFRHEFRWLSDYEQQKMRGK